MLKLLEDFLVCREENSQLPVKRSAYCRTWNIAHPSRRMIVVVVRCGCVMALHALYVGPHIYVSYSSAAVVVNSNPDHSQGWLDGADGSPDRVDDRIYGPGVAIFRLAAGAAGFHRSRRVLRRLQGQVRAGQVGSGRAVMSCQARTIASAHGQFAGIFQRLRRPPRTRRAAAFRTR